MRPYYGHWEALRAIRDIHRPHRTPRGWVSCPLCDVLESVADAEFIAHARSDERGLVAENRELRAAYIKGGERSWALSVVLALINDDELGCIVSSLSIPDIDRFAAAVDGYKPDIQARDGGKP